jgi:hypothetical protein
MKAGAANRETPKKGNNTLAIALSLSLEFNQGHNQVGRGM